MKIVKVSTGSRTHDQFGSKNRNQALRREFIFYKTTFLLVGNARKERFSLRISTSKWAHPRDLAQETGQWMLLETEPKCLKPNCLNRVIPKYRTFFIANLSNQNDMLQKNKSRQLYNYKEF